MISKSNSTKTDSSLWTDSTEIPTRAAKWGKISLVALGMVLLIGITIAAVYCFKTQTTYWDRAHLCWVSNSNGIFSAIPIVDGGFSVTLCFVGAIGLHLGSRKNYRKPEEKEKAKQLLLSETPLELQKALRLSHKDSLGAAVRSELISIKDGERIQEMMKEYSTADSTVQRLKDGSPELKDRTPVGMIYEEHRKERDAAQGTLNKLSCSR